MFAIFFPFTFSLLNYNTLANYYKLHSQTNLYELMKIIIALVIYVICTIVDSGNANVLMIDKESLQIVLYVTNSIIFS